MQAQSLGGTAAPTGFHLVLLASDVIADLIVSDRPKPTAESVTGPIAVEIADVSRDGKKNILDNVWGVISLHPGPATPSINHWRVHIDKPLPSLWGPNLDSVQ